MGTLADVFVRIRGNVTALQEDARAAGERAGREAGQQFGGSFTSMVKTAALGIGTLLAGRGLLQLGENGLKTAANLQMAQVAFTTLIGNAQQAQKFLGDLKSFAAATPFELPGLVDDARLLMGVGVAAKNVIPTLTAWGNAAGALGVSSDRFNNAMLAVSQSLGSGKINAGDMNQIINAGIPIWKLMAEATGKTVPELRKLSEQGKLLSTDILPKVQAQMNKDYGGAMAAQANTLAGVWSTLVDTVNIGIANAFQPLIPLMSAAVPAAASLFSRGLAAGSQGMVNLIAAVKTGLQGQGSLAFLKTVLSEASDGVKGLVASFNGADTTSKGFVGGMQNLGSILRDVYDASVSTWGWIRDNVLPILKDVGDALGTATGWMLAHKDAIYTVVAVVGTLVAIERVQAAVTLVTSGALLAKVTALAVVRGAVIAYNVVQALMNSGMYTWLAVQAIDLGAWIARTARIIASTVATAAHAVVIGVVRVATMAWTAAQWLLNVAMEANPIGLIILAIGLLVVAFVYLWNHSAAFRNFWISMWNAIWGFLKAVGAWFAGPFANFFVSAWNYIKLVFTTTWDRIKDGFNSAVSFIGGIPGKIWGFFSGLASQFWSLGSNIVNSIINGIESMVGGLASKAADMAKSALHAAESVLGIASPSKEFIRIGRQSGAGMVQGLDSSQIDVSRAVQRVTGQRPSAGTPGGVRARTEDLLGDIRDLLAGLRLTVDSTGLALATRAGEKQLAYVEGRR